MINEETGFVYFFSTAHFDCGVFETSPLASRPLVFHDKSPALFVVRVKLYKGAANLIYVLRGWMGGGLRSPAAALDGMKASNKRRVAVEDAMAASHTLW